MKKYLLFLSFVFFATYASAQTTPAFSIAINGGIPVQEGYSFTVGADLQADFPVAPTTKITASAGYQNYSIKGGGSGYFIPVLGGVKFSLGSEQIYGHAQLGYGFGKNGGGSFAYAPSVGYYFSPNFDASLKYLAFSEDGYKLGSFNVRLAYNF